MCNNSIFRPFLLLTVGCLSLISCDKDYNSIGGGLIGDNHFDLTKFASDVVAYNQEISPIQSNDLGIDALGVYDDPAFGKTTANFATQVSFAETPNIGVNAVIDSVYLDIPYFINASKSTALSTGGFKFETDSVYGDKTSKIKLSIFESGRYMGAQGGVHQAFYTNQNAEFDRLKVGSRLNDDANTNQNDEFVFSPGQHILTAKDASDKKTYTYLAPGMHLKLNQKFFTDKILDAPVGQLATGDVFGNYFRGLYFKVEQSGTDSGSLAMINFAKGKITIYYKEDKSETDAVKTSKIIEIKLAGSTASLLEKNTINPAYSSALSAPDTALGDERLYLKGGEGAMTIVSLFGEDLYGEDGITGTPNGVADGLDVIRKNGWLINEANLVFNIDETAMLNSYEPQRVYLYDLNNKRPVVDYHLDGTSGTTSKKSKVIFDGNINLDPVTKRGASYKIRITNHIRNLVKYADSTNVKIGVVVTENIAEANSNKWQTPKTATTIVPKIPNYIISPPKTPDFAIETPRASVMSPLGTIIYGSNANVPVDKRLKLEIYYTKPN